MIKKNNYIRDLNDEEIEEIKYHKRLFKKYQMNLKTQIYKNIYIKHCFYNIYYRMDNEFIETCKLLINYNGKEVYLYISSKYKSNSIFKSRSYFTLPKWADPEKLTLMQAVIAYPASHTSCPLPGGFDRGYNVY